MSEHKEGSSPLRFVYTFLGVGSSSAQPRLSYCLKNPEKYLKPHFTPRLYTPCVLLQALDASNTVHFQYVIDMGFMFHVALLDHLQRLFDASHSDSPSNFLCNHVTPQFHGLLITHSHADAVNGIDFTREVMTAGEGFPLYADAKCMEELKTRLPNYFEVPEPAWRAHRVFFDTHSLQWFEPISLCQGALTVIPIPLHHGAVICCGYIFQAQESQVAYFSDFNCPGVNQDSWQGATGRKVYSGPLTDFLSCFVDRERTLEVLRSKPVSTMVLDTLYSNHTHPGHVSWIESELLISALESEGVNLSQAQFFGIGFSHEVCPEWAQSLSPPSRITYTVQGMQFSH